MKNEKSVAIETFLQRERDYFSPMLQRQQRASLELREQWRQETVHQRRERVSMEVFSLLKGKVIDGPFTGLQLSDTPWWGKADLGSMVLGLYEKEILDWIGGLAPGQFESFIDIGAADGYYGCGMLLSGKVEQAICFEQSPKGQTVIEQNWLRNGEPGRLKVLGEANRSSLQALTDIDFKKTLILMDVEGAEFHLMDEAFFQLVAGSTILLEVHSWIDDFEMRYARLLHAAALYFDISVIDRVERPTLKFDFLRDFTDDNRLLLTSEGRPCLMRFLRFTPRAS